MKIPRGRVLGAFAKCLPRGASIPFGQGIFGGSACSRRNICSLSIG